MTFPGTQAARESDGSLTADLNCVRDLDGGSQTYAPGSDTQSNFQIVPFSSDYRYSDTPTSHDPLATLNPNSNLVRAVYWPGDGCPNGGYPINTPGPPGSSISGGDAAPATNDVSASIARGSSRTAVNAGIGKGDSASTTSGIPITQGRSTTRVTGTPITQGASTSAVSKPGTIGGGVSVATDRRTVRISNAASILVPAPSNYTVGSFELVTVTARGLASGNAICAPAAAPTWNVIATATSGPGTSAITQTTFWTTTSSTAADTFRTFPSVACTGTIHPTASQISALSINYTNVDPTIAPRVSTTPAGNPNGTVFTAPPLPNVPANDMVVSIFGSDVAGFSNPAPTLNEAGAPPSPISSGADDGLQAATGPAPQRTARAGVSVAWTAQTIALSAVSSITVAPPSDYTADGGNLLLVSIGVQALGTGVICKPPGWTGLASTSSGTGPNQLTQQVFWTTSSTQYQFTFNSNTNSLGTPVNAGASLVATTYEGVDTSIAPTLTSTSNPAPAATLTAPQNGTAAVNEEVVSFFATLDDYGGANVPSLHTTPSGVSTNTGEDAVTQRASGNQSPQATATTGNAAVWAAETVDLTPALLSSITAAPPLDFAANGSNLLLVSIGVQALGTGVICTPPGWTALASTSSGTGANQLTQQVFWTTSTTQYQFKFNSNTNCGGTPVKAGASLVATTYEGVDTSVAPTLTRTANPAAGATLTAPQNGTAAVNEEVVSFFATLDDYGGANVPSVHTTPSGGWTNTGEDAATQRASGNQNPQATATTGNAAVWAAETVVLMPTLSSSITIPAVQGYSPTDGNNDLLLASIAVRALGSNVICAPDANWTRIAITSSGTGADQITQAAYWTTSSTSRIHVQLGFELRRRYDGEGGRECGCNQLHRSRRNLRGRSSHEQSEPELSVDHPHGTEPRHDESRQRGGEHVRDARLVEQSAAPATRGRDHRPVGERRRRQRPSGSRRPPGEPAAGADDHVGELDGDHGRAVAAAQPDDHDHASGRLRRRRRRLHAGHDRGSEPRGRKYVRPRYARLELEAGSALARQPTRLHQDLRVDHSRGVLHLHERRGLIHILVLRTRTATAPRSPSGRAP